MFRVDTSHVLNNNWQPFPTNIHVHEERPDVQWCMPYTEDQSHTFVHNDLIIRYNPTMQMSILEI